MRSLRWIAGGIAVTAGLGLTAAAGVRNATPPAPNIVVYKSPTCGCCAKWVDHLRANGFTVTTEDVADLSAVKQRFHVGQQLQSCHTAVAGDYVFEGHVPADLVAKFLAEPPAGAMGLAVPGMPLGSPGMESANPQAYDVLVFDARGGTRVFARR
ncbi:MAG: DUF411 domain-containing protein [Gemmatimonadetes bacterium]|nr:DUF411 domain-containing protein [Gemmatimonadota bacterium]